MKIQKAKNGDKRPNKDAEKKGPPAKKAVASVPPVISPLEAAILESASQLLHSGIKDDSFQKKLHDRLQSAGAKRLWDERLGSKK